MSSRTPHSFNLVEFIETRTKVKVGDLSSLHHGVSGEGYASDEKTLVIENFHYDGRGE